MADNTNNAAKIDINNNIWYGVGVFDYLNTSGIYVGYLTPFLLEIFKRVLQNIFFPLYAAATIVYMVLGIRHMLLDRVPVTGKLKKENILRVAVNVFSALVVTAAVVTTLAFSAVVGVASTVLFAANLGVTGIYNFACSAYFLHRYRQKGKELENPALTPEERNKLEEDRKIARGKAIGYLVVGATIVMVGVAGALALLGGILPLAALGVAAGLIGAGFCIYALVKAAREKKQKEQEASSDQQLIAARSDSTSKLLQEFEKEPAKKNSEVEDKVKELDQKPALVLLGENDERRALLSDSDVDDDELLHTPTMTYKQ